MVLEQYRAKRDFHKTPEPQARPGKTHRQPIFVIQEHHASRLHYDFRLEADGVLKSWAVPKEPAMDPSQKRLAVHVEDHPLGYATFHGRIPEGQYGAGTVKIWDHGTYENLMAEKPVPQTVSQAIDSGHLEFDLHGKKLKGRFALIRMQGGKFGKKDNWLLIKMKDELARPEPDSEPEPVPRETGRRKQAAARTIRPSKSSPPPADGVTLTHGDKLMFPADGITKADVFDYYRRISEHLLPFLRDRPITLERLPEGVDGAHKPHFWQKNTPSQYPEWIPRIDLPSEAGKSVQYALVNNQETLLYLVNQGALTFHTWFSRVADLDHPDFVLFDLDPGQATFADAVHIAQTLHEILKENDQEAFLKTSGKAGLHVLVPWQKPGGYDEARNWAESIATQVVEVLPKQATLERSKATRGKRVYVDVMQNARGHHAVPPYVLRAVREAPVSTPLSWRELTPELNPAENNLKTIFRRLKRQKSDPMAPLVRAFTRSQPAEVRESAAY
ncbi:MAG TPA: non-homologous end-joining DNA ligase [Gemmataceae bacterium]|nr:non-homologous end-joining DNA ligase [Gemmataceae bacterium]